MCVCGWVQVHLQVQMLAAGGGGGGGVAAGWGSRPAGCAGSPSPEEGALATPSGRELADSGSEQLSGHLGFWGGERRRL